MKILFLTYDFPNQLNRIRSLNILKCLRSSGHKTFLLSLVQTKNIPDYDKIADLCEHVETVFLPKGHSYLNCAKKLVSNLPMRVAYCSFVPMKEKISDIMKKEKFDAIYVKRKRMSQFAEDIKNIPKILDLTDAVSLQYHRALDKVSIIKLPFYLREAFALKQYEVNTILKYNAAVLCSGTDKTFLENIANRQLDNIRIIPNVVDLNDFPEGQNRKKTERSYNIVFSGLMDRYVNADAALFFLKKIFPLIKSKIPMAKFFIVGPNPPSSVKKHAHEDNIAVTGYVKDISEYIKKADIIVSPVRIGSGSRNKILQAMAMGKPVVSTSIGAEGLNAVSGVHLFISDTPDDFAGRIIELLNNEELQRKIGENARKLVEQDYSLPVMRKKIEDLLNFVTGN